MSVEQQFQAAFDQNARGALQSVIAWIPEGLLPGSELKDTDREALFAEFVKFKQDIVSGLLNSVYKVAHTTSSVSHQSVQDSVALATKGPAKSANEKWFLDQIDRSRLPSAILTNRVEYLIDNYCVSKTALPSDLDPLKLACETALRQKRIDFKQKLRKSFRKTISEAFPPNLPQFQQQVVEAVCAALSQEIPLDIVTAYNSLSAGCIRFYKSVAGDLDKDRAQHSFLNFDKEEEENDILDDHINGAQAIALMDEDEDPEGDAAGEGMEGEDNPKKRKHASGDDSGLKKPKKPRSK